MGFSRFFGRWHPRAAYAALAALLAACAATSPVVQRQDELLAAIRARDFALADTLIVRHPRELSARHALAIAIKLGDVDAIKAYAARAGVNAPLDGSGSTSLMVAAMSAPRDAAPRIATTLLDMGADPTLRDGAGKSASQLARWRGEFGLAGMLDEQAVRIERIRKLTAALARATPWLPAAGDAAFEGAARPASAARGPGGAHVAGVVKLASSERSPALRTRPGSARAPEPPPGPAITASRLVRSNWVPVAGTEAADQPYAAFRFHADGTGDLLRYTPRDGRADVVPDAYVAWQYDASQLSFAVLAADLVAWCRAVGSNASQLAVACRDFELPDALDPVQMVSLDFARVVLDSAAARARLTPAEEVRAVLQPRAPTCKPAASRRPVDAKAQRALRAARSADWHAFDASGFAVYSPASGAACAPAEAERAALAACRAGGRRCVSVPGCRAGQASAVASAQGWNTAVVACSETLQDARREALARCREQAGCDCTLIGSHGNNLATSRAAECSVPSALRARRPLLDAASEARAGLAPARLAHSAGRNPSTER